MFVTTWQAILYAMEMMDRLRSEEKCKVGYLIVFGCLACQKQTKRKCQHIVRPLESTVKDSNSSLTTDCLSV